MTREEMMELAVKHGKEKMFKVAYSGKSKATAIKAKCVECMNFALVSSCNIKSCPLYEVRGSRKQLREWAKEPIKSS